MTMAESLAFHAVGMSGPMTSLRRLVEDYERRLILDALERTGGNQRRAAAELGCLPTTLNEKMRRLGLRACDQSSAGQAGSRSAETGVLELTGTA
jgi:DNA-binding NtrC family response regulator